MPARVFILFIEIPGALFMLSSSSKFVPRNYCVNYGVPSPVFFNRYTTSCKFCGEIFRMLFSKFHGEIFIDGFPRLFVKSYVEVSYIGRVV